MTQAAPTLLAPAMRRKGGIDDPDPAHADDQHQPLDHRHRSRHAVQPVPQEHQREKTQDRGGRPGEQGAKVADRHEAPQSEVRAAQSDRCRGGHACQGRRYRQRRPGRSRQTPDCRAVQPRWARQRRQGPRRPRAPKAAACSLSTTKKTLPRRQTFSRRRIIDLGVCTKSEHVSTLAGETSVVHPQQVAAEVKEQHRMQFMS